MLATQNQNIITLSGSAQMVSEFFEYSINTILYQRGIYPPEDFNRVSKYGLSMVIACNEALSSYIKNMITQVRCWLESNDLHNLVLVIFGLDSQKVLERWTFSIETDKDVAQSNGSITKEKDITVIQKEIQAIIRQITASVTFLPLLDEPCTFEVLVYTNRNAEVPLKWEDSDPHCIPNAQTVKLRSFCTNIHEVNTAVSYQNNNINIVCFIIIFKMSNHANSVFQCAKCNTIVCDSQCNILINDELQIISADKATNVTVLDKTKLLLGGPGDGSTYLDVVCNNCKTVIGKTFKSTTNETDIYRNTFSFNMDCINTYVLGSCNLDRKEGITKSKNSNAILLSFDAERAMKDLEYLDQLKFMIETLSKRVDTIEHSKDHYLCL